MDRSVLATIKGGLGTSIDILLDGIHQVGDVISFNNITNIIPSDEDYTRFFYKCIDFCKSNGSSRLFRIDRIMHRGEQYEIHVSPVMA